VRHRLSLRAASISSGPNGQLRFLVILIACCKLSFQNSTAIDIESWDNRADNLHPYLSSGCSKKRTKADAKQLAPFPNRHRRFPYER
jgi:hypothetical protein